MPVGVLTRNSTAACDFQVEKELATFWVRCGIAQTDGRHRIRLLGDYQVRQLPSLPIITCSGLSNLPKLEYIKTTYDASQDEHPCMFLVSTGRFSSCPGDGMMRYLITKFPDGQEQHPVGQGNETTRPKYHEYDRSPLPAPPKAMAAHA